MATSAVHNYGFTEAWEMMDGAAGATFTAVIFVIALALILYARRMKERGVLT